MESASSNKLAEVAAKILTEAATKEAIEKAKTPEDKERERREMEQALKKLEQETIKKHREFCARMVALLDQDQQLLMPALDTVPDEAFLKGPIYAMGSIIHRMEEVVHTTAKRVRREMEVECAKELGRVLAPLNTKRTAFNTQKEREIDALRKEKQAKIMEAQTQIAMEYNEKIKQVDERTLPEEITELTKKRDQYEANYHKQLAENEDAEQKLVDCLQALLKTAESELAANRK